MADKCLLFTYGLLRPGAKTAPKSASAAWPDRVRGELYDLGEFPAAVGIGRPQGDWINGIVVEIDTAELTDLDAFEDVDSGEFHRLSVTSEAGHHCWIYEYGYALPLAAKKVASWP